jgi:hypothetical protein
MPQYIIYNNTLYPITPPTAVTSITTSSVMYHNCYFNIIGPTGGTAGDWYYDTIRQTTASSSIWIDRNVFATPTYPVSQQPIARPAIIPRRTIEQEARDIIRQLDRMRDAKKVKQVSTRLLLSTLNEDQRQTFLANGWFVVEGGRSKQRYRIHSRSYAGNVDVLDGDNAVERLCAHCSHEIPLADHLLAQKMMLELAEDDFLRLANRRRLA